jgi:hypothetical protein
VSLTTLGGSYATVRGSNLSTNLRSLFSKVLRRPPDSNLIAII